MAVLISMAKIEALTLTRTQVEGAEVIKITGTVALVSENGTVVAKQDINGYNGLKVDQSRETKTKLNALIESVREDIELTVGIREEATNE